MVKPRTFPVVILAALAAALAGCNADPMRNPHAAQIWGPLECQRQGNWRRDWWKNPIAPRRYRWFDSGGPDNRPYRRLTVFDQPNRTVGERCQLGFDDWGHHWGTKGSFQVYREGEHRITAFWLRFRHNFPLHTRAWQIVSDMGQAEPALSAGGPPVLALYADRHRLHLLHYRRQLWRSAPVQKGTWIQIFENVVYSRHPNQGAIKVGVDLNGDGDRSDPGEHSHRIRTSTLKQETQPWGPIPRRASIPSVLRIGPYHAPAIHCPEGCSLDVGRVGVVRASRKPPPPGDSCGWGTFSATNEPGACWRPYSDSSPWNTPVGAQPSLAPNSDAIVKRLLGFGRIAGPVSGSSGTAHDWYHPVYWSKPSDPVYTLHFAYKGADGLYHQVTRGSSPELEGAQIHIPADAQAASGSDHHLTVIDQSTGWEYSMYFEHLINLPPNGGDITAIGGGRENVITGDGRGVDATAGYFPAGRATSGRPRSPRARSTTRCSSRSTAPTRATS